MRTDTGGSRPRRMLVTAAVAVAMIAGGGVPALADEPARGPDRAATATSEVAPDFRTLYEGQTITYTLTGTGDATTTTVTESLTRDYAAEANEQAAQGGTQVAAAPKIKCWRHHRNLVLRSSVFRTVIYKWQHLVRWCFKGNKTHKLKVDRGLNIQTDPTWEFVGNRSMDKNRTKRFFYREMQGHYRLCQVEICLHRYPRHGARYLNGWVKTYVAKNK